MLGGLLAAPPAAAAPPVVTQNSVDELSCVFDTAQGDAVYFFASASAQDASSGSGAFVETPAGEIVLRGEGGTATFGDAFAGDVALTDEAAAAAGMLSVRLGLGPAGEPVVEHVDERDGNVRTTGTITQTEYAITVTSVDLPGYTVLPATGDCSGARHEFDLRTTNPRVQVIRSTTFGSQICALSGIADAEVRLSGTSRSQPFVEVVIDDGVSPQKASGELSLRGGSGTVTVPLVDLTTGEPVADLAIAVDLRRSGPGTREVASGPGIQERTRFTPFVATVEVVSSDGRSGTATCAAFEAVTVTRIDRR
jgi:hypothetical protein